MPASTSLFRRLAALTLIALAAAPRLAAQGDYDLPRLARWFEDEAPLYAQSSDESTATGNLRMVAYLARATFSLDSCRLRITLTDNSGVSGNTATTEVPIDAVDSAAVRLVSRPNGWRDFIYIPGRYFVVIPAREGLDWPFLRTTTRGTQRANATTVPALSPEAAAVLISAIHRAGVLCGAPTKPPS